MVKTKLFGVQIGVDFTFFAVIAMYFALDSTGFALMSIAVCAVHEFGHIIAMLLSKKRLTALLFKGGGIKIQAAGNDSLFVLAAGSALNISIFFALFFTLPKTNIYPVMFAVLNLIIGLFNLLAFGCLDGKRILSLVLGGKGEKGEKIVAVIEKITIFLVATAIATAFIFFDGGINFTIAAVMIYIITVDVFSRMFT